MGSVYLGEHAIIGKKVAIKLSMRKFAALATRAVIGVGWFVLCGASAIGCGSSDNENKGAAAIEQGGAGVASNGQANGGSNTAASNGGAVNVNGGGTGARGASGTSGSAVGAGGSTTGKAGSSGGSAGFRNAGGRTAGGSTGNGGTGDGTVLHQIPATPLPTVESESFSPSGVITDIADDAAIYANATAPELSVVIADNKDDNAGGVGVFNMQGKLLQFRQDGMIGNVDLRGNFPFGGKNIVLVGANNRTTNTLIFWQFDPTTRQLSEPIGDTIATVSPSYGLCMYHSAKTGKFYAFVTQETGNSTMEQYELKSDGGKVTATQVRSFQVGSITEGCAADDELGRLYVAQEDVALWKYDAEPSGGSTRTKVAEVGDGHVVADMEGVALAKGPGTSGYLVVSIQSQSRFVTYDRETNAYLMEFTVGENGSIDSVSQTDGLDISTSNLGPGFTKGALIVHDGSNSGGESSNLKYVPLN